MSRSCWVWWHMPNPSFQKAGRVWGQPGLHNKTITQRKRKREGRKEVGREADRQTDRQANTPSKQANLADALENVGSNHTTHSNIPCSYTIKAILTSDMVLLTTKCKERFFKANCILAFVVIYARKVFYQKYFQFRKVHIRKFIMHCLVWAENFDKMLLYLPSCTSGMWFSLSFLLHTTVKNRG